MKKGFTLIEILVVVLIMGILASVAMPMFYTSVEKARVHELVEVTRSYMRAQDSFFMKRGRYTSSVLDRVSLDFTWPNPPATFAGLGGTTHFDCTQQSSSSVIFIRKESVPFYGQYRISIHFASNKSPYSVTSVECPLCRGRMNILSSFEEAFNLKCSDVGVCYPKE